MNREKARKIMREYQSGFIKLNPIWCAIEELIKDSEKLEKIEQIVNEKGNIWSASVDERLKEILKEE